MAIELVSFPIENGGSFHSFLYVYQRVYIYTLYTIYIYIDMLIYVVTPWCLLQSSQLFSVFDCKVNSFAPSGSSVVPWKQPDELLDVYQLQGPLLRYVGWFITPSGYESIPINTIFGSIFKPNHKITLW